MATVGKKENKLIKRHRSKKITHAENETSNVKMGATGIKVLCEM